jgi:hypothetical protein
VQQLRRFDMVTEGRRGRWRGPQWDDGDAARFGTGRSVNQDDPRRRSESFGEFGGQLVAGDRVDAIDGDLVGERTGDCLTDAIIAAQRVAVTDDERVSGHFGPLDRRSGRLAIGRTCFIESQPVRIKGSSIVSSPESAQLERNRLKRRSVPGLLAVNPPQSLDRPKVEFSGLKPRN